MTPGTVLLDLDGTLYDKGAAIGGAAEAVDRLRAAGHTLRFFTNTDSQSEQALIERLSTLGFAVDVGELFTPVVAAQRVLAAAPAARAVLLVNEVVRAELAPHCSSAAYTDADDATHVVIGDFRDGLSYAALDAAFRAVRAGAELLALQRGRYFRAADGPHLDTGALVAAVEYAAERTARVLGKPTPDFLALAAASAGAAVGEDEIWVVGDDRATDILMGNEAGAITVQPRTGKYGDQASRADLAVPQHVITSIAELPDLMARVRR